MTNEECIKMLKSKLDGNTDTSYEWVETVRMAIKALEQQPCEDAISRSDAINSAIDAVDEWDGGCNTTRANIITKAINGLPSVQPQPKIRYWIAMSEGFSPYKCSECGGVEFKKSKYCPNCGADMGECEKE